MPTQQQLVDCYRFVYGALARHWQKSAAVAAAVAALALLGTLVMPRSYYSEARLFVRFGRENQVDPTATSGQMVSLYESRESEINSLIEILKSRAILDRVVAELGPHYILSGKGSRPPLRGGARREHAGRAEHPGTLQDHREADASHSPAAQRAVAELQRTVSIWTPRKSNIITVVCKAHSPAIAQKIVAKLVEVYLEEHLRVHRSPGSYEFFQQQTEQSLAAWRMAADRLRDMKNRLGIVTIEGERRKLEDQIADIDARLLANQAELKTAEGKIASLKTLIAGLPEKIVTQSVESPHAAFDGMRQTLYQLEGQEQELAAKMQESHPRLAAVRQQVVDLRRILSDQPPDRLQATEAINPSRQALELSLLTESSQAEALVARENSLLASQQQLRKELQQLNTQAIAVEQLQQQVELAEANHKEYAQKLELARINRSLDEERISSLSLVQPASYVANATGPRRLLVLAVGLVIAALSGLGTALVAAWINPVLTTAKQLSSLLDLPLAGVIPAATTAA